MALYPEGTAPLPLDDVQRAANKANELTRQSMGLNGSVVLSGSGSTTGNYVAIQVLAQAVFTSLSGNGITGIASLVTTIPAGVVIFGNFTEVSISSGLVVIYNA